jgi:hypothetical protein
VADRKPRDLFFSLTYNNNYTAMLQRLFCTLVRTNKECNKAENSIVKHNQLAAGKLIFKSKWN